MNRISRLVGILSLLLLSKMVVAVGVEVFAQSPSITRPELKEQGGHSANVSSVAFSADGKFALLGSYDNTATLWEVDSGRELRSFIGHTERIVAVSFSPDGKFVLTGSEDGTARRWDSSTGREVQIFRLTGRQITSVAYSPDGGHVLTGSDDRIIRLWDVKSGKESQRFVGHSGLKLSVAFSPDGKYVLSGGGFENRNGVSMAMSNGIAVNLGQPGDSIARLWETSSGKQVRTLQGHSDSIMAVAFSPNGTRVLTGSWDGTARLWNANTGELEHIFRANLDIIKSDLSNAYHNCILSVAFSPDGKSVLTHSYNGTARLWDVATETEVRRFPGDGRYFSSASYSPTGDYVLTGSGATLWDASTGKPVRLFKRQSGQISSLAYSPDGKYLLVAAGDGTARLWDLVKGRQVHVFSESSDPHRSLVMSVAFSPNSKYVLTGGTDGVAILWDRETGERLRRFVVHQYWVSSVAFSPDGEYVLTGGQAGILKLWDVNTDEAAAPRTFYPQFSMVSAVGFSPDGKYVLSGSDMGVQLSETHFDIHDPLKGAMRTLNSAVAFSPDGKYFLTGDAKGKLKLWETDPYTGPLKLIRIMGLEFPLEADDEGKKHRTFKGASGSIASVAFSPSGYYAATGEEDGTVRLWLVGKRKNVGTLVGHTGKVSAVTFSPDDQYLFTGGVDGTARLWRLSDRKELCRMVSIRGGSWVVIDSARFDADTLESTHGLSWIMADDPMTALPLEVFMRDYYEPRLLQRILKSDTLPEVPSLAELNRIQPTIENFNIKPHADNANLVDVTVRVSSVSGQCLRESKRVNCESGVYDLRLYRDGQLVQQSPAANESTTNLAGVDWRQQLQKWQQTSVVKNKEGKPVTAMDGPQEITFTDIQLPKRAGVSQVEFTAYAFNKDRVKSATSKPAVYPLPQPRPGAQRRAFLITVGVDVTSAGWRLRFARKGVSEIEALLQKSLGGGQQYQVVPVQLLSAYQKGRAEPLDLGTKRNIQTVLNILSGRAVPKADREKIPHQEQLQSATPDDLVVLYIASHGYVDPAGKFYVIPSDIGSPLGVSEELLDRCLKNSEQSSSCDNGRTLLQRGISSEELTQWLEAIDAGQMVLILDSCHSGAVTGPGFKPGPMGDRSFGQLSYDKGMLVLAAAQAEQLDTGTLALGNRSLLTYALTQERSGPVVDLRQWLSAAEERVPRLYQQFGKANSDANESDQQPVLFDFAKQNRSPN